MVFLQYLTTVFDTIDEAILLIGVEAGEAYRLLMVNAAFTRTTGHTIHDVGKLVDEITEPQTYEKLLPRYRKVVTSKKPLHYSEWYDVPLGKAYFDVKLVPIFNAVGECVHIAAITHNNTEINRLREQVKESIETLENVAFNLKQL